ncbi:MULTISPECIES: hypothetical protein [unclassified Arthrobacter]|uniref:hypothetical protein n=1 Tax=unclassified Arthrobacter TaxID=235627 RepID=UPI000CE340C9|nr:MULTISPECIES: hypothetical protein [unclassified Arthrobacter]
MYLSDLERFQSYVLRGPREDSCWIWLGAVSDDGYGRFWVKTPGGQKALSAHRFALSVINGGMEGIEGLESLHHCDVPMCVRATEDAQSHLILGTRSENMIDRARKGRLPSAAAIKWRYLPRAEQAARTRSLRDELKRNGWQDQIVRQLIYGINAVDPTLF